MCPRSCTADRKNKPGYCGCGDRLRVSRAALHYWEEPCISGKNGSGAVFFSGCPLRCVFCQNHYISTGETGIEIDNKRLVEIFFELADQGAENINLVTADHFIGHVADAICDARSQGFELPFVYNCSGYEKAEVLKCLEGLIDIYLPDFKYMDPALAARYSNAPDYPDVAKAAVAEMVRQRPAKVLDSRGIMKSGVIVRHLLLPGHVLDSRKVIRYLFETYGNKVTLSLMNQYTPMPQVKERFPELYRKVRRSEYEKLVDFALKIGVTEAFIQEGETAKESFIPEFDNVGVLNMGQLP